MNILVVEDHPLNRKLLCAVLQAEGHPVVAAANGHEALAALERGPVDAILSDILMPGMDGYRLCYEVRRHPRWKKLPFVFYSAVYNQAIDEKLARDLGADALLSKPTPTRVILEHLNRALVSQARPAPRAETAELDVLKAYSERLVSKLEETNDELSASVARYRTILDTEPECVNVVAADGRLVEINLAGLAMLEADSLAQVASKPLLDYLLPPYRDAFASLHQRVLAGESGTLEFELLGLRGTRRWLETHAAPLRAADGSVLSLLGITRDITVRKHAEEERDQLFKHSLDLLCVANFNGWFQDLNPAWTALLGWTIEELRSRPWLEFVHPLDQQATAAAGNHLRAGQSVRSFTNRYLHKDGSYRWLSWSAFPQPDRQLIFAVCRDVTERRRAEAVSSGQKRVLEMIATGLPLAQTLDALLRVVEDQSPELLCSVLLLDADGQHLRHAAAPSLPAAYTAAIDGVAIGPNAGSCGTAAFRRQPVYVEDIAVDPLWADYRAVALPHGLRACWSTPIIDEQQAVLGTFAIFLQQPGGPTALHLQLIESVRHTAGIAISRQRFEARNREQLEELLRWQAVTLHREERVQALKAEVNELLALSGRPARYADPTAR